MLFGKIKPSLITLSGKHREDVHVDSSRYPTHIRKTVRPGTKKHEPGFMKEYTRTAYLNQLASEVNNIISANSDGIRPRSFYEELHRRFRREPLDNRFLLLLQLKGMEVNPGYPLGKLGTQDISVSVLKKTIEVNVRIKNHPPTGKHDANCYEVQAMMITWGKRVSHEVQLSEWLDMGPRYADLYFDFHAKPNTEHWLLCLLIRLGINKKPITVMAATGMQIIEAGSFVKEDMEIFEKRQKEREALKSRASAKQQTKEVKRVKPRRML